MKTYPKALADLDVLRDILSSIYSRAESDLADAKRYREQAEEDGESNNPESYYIQNAVECEAKAAAWSRLAERLVK